jgi:GTP diphosphokinase / guanosine-3',5'-bis(diphosphate) 3'-diphosphatase
MDVIKMPEGSSALDFAFMLNPSLAKRMSHAKVNGEDKPIHTVLKNMDIVEVVTEKKKTLHVNWLNYVCTSKAMKAINEEL